jgi:hypothetical protein
MASLKAGALYFAVVFGAGFVLGPVRVLWAVPRFGTRLAELMEMPLMLVVIVLAARGIVRRFAVPPAASARLGMGGAALALLLSAELALLSPVRGMSLRGYLAGLDPVSGTAYLGMLGVFALMPLLVARDAGRPAPPVEPVSRPARSHSAAGGDG